MRLDKFLKVTQIIKRRTVANETASEGFILLNGKNAKPAAKVEIGDILEIDMWNYYKKIEILKTPEKNSIPKQELDEYIKILEYKAKNSNETY